MANYSVIIANSAKKEIKGLHSDVIKRVLGRINELRENPYPVDCKKLKPDLGLRVRVGDYRIVYTVDNTNKIIKITKLGHRKEVYRNL